MRQWERRSKFACQGPESIENPQRPLIRPSCGGLLRCEHQETGMFIPGLQPQNSLTATSFHLSLRRGWGTTGLDDITYMTGGSRMSHKIDEW